MATRRVARVGKTYPNGCRAIRGLDLEIRDGELMVVVGPSGCGKSTFLRLLAGLETISSGTLLIDGAVANDLTPQARNIAMVFQDYALYPTMTVRENLAFPLKMRRLPPPERQRRVRWAAELLDLGGVLERLPRELSGGQRQRVAMGRALVREPSCWTSRCPTWTPGCAPRCARKSATCSSAPAPPWSTSPTIRWKP